MVIRAGVDDRADDLGARDQHPADVRDRVHRRLRPRGVRRRVGASQGDIASGQDGQWLLNSLVVVIIGGMGSIFGAAAGSMLYGLVFVANFGASYLPTTGTKCCTQYSIDPHVRPDRARPGLPPARALREGRVRPERCRRSTRRARRSRWVPSCSSSSGRRLGSSDYWARLDPPPDVPLRDRGREPDLPLGLRRHGLARADGAVRDRRLCAREHGRQGRGGRDEGPPPRLGPDGSALVARDRVTTLIGLVVGAVARRSAGIYFLMITLTYSVIAYYFFGQVTQDLRLLGHRRDRPLHAGVGSATCSPTRTGSTTSRSVVAVVRLRAHPLPRANAVRALAPGRARRADPDGVARLQRARSTGRSPSASAAFVASLAGVLYVWWTGRWPRRRRSPRDDQPADHGRDRRPRAGSRARGSERSCSS